MPAAYQNKVKKTITDLVDFVTEERKRRNLSQEKFAEMLNLSTKIYQCYEQGSRKPSVETLVLMLHMLDLQIKIAKKP